MFNKSLQHLMMFQLLNPFDTWDSIIPKGDNTNICFRVLM